MQTLLLALYARTWRIVLAGGTEMAHAKARILAAACDRLVWVGAAEGHDVACETVPRPPEPDDFEAARIVVISTGDREEEARLADAARARGALVNVVDRPEISDFSFPALIDRGAITVAVSSGGGAPVVVRWARGLVERALPARLGDLAEFVSARRKQAKAALGGIPQARRFWDRALEGEMGRAMLAGEAETAEAAFERGLAGGAEPGACTIVWSLRAEADDLSLGGLRVLGAADRVYHAAEAGPLLDMARRDADRGRIDAEADLPAAILPRVAAGKTIAVLFAGPDARDAASALAEALGAAGLRPRVTPALEP